MQIKADKHGLNMMLLEKFLQDYIFSETSAAICR